MAAALEKKTMLQRLETAAKHAPKGTYARMGRNGRQMVYDVIHKGRKDESIIENVLNDVKAASQQLCDEITKANNKVQEA